MTDFKKNNLERLKGSQFLYNYKRSGIAIVSSIILLLVILIALFGPMITIQDPYNLATLDLDNAYLPPFPLEGSKATFLFGTDQQGRDLLSTIVYGSRTSLFISIVSVVLCISLGVTLGLIAGYFGGWFDTLIMRIADIQLSFPSMLVALFLMSLIGRGINNIILSLTIIGWVKYARVIRGETLALKNKEFIDAMRVMGQTNFKIIIKHILPNVVTSLLVLGTMQIGSFILFEASLSFLGLGVPVTEPSLGTLCNEGFKVMFGGLWWVSIIPGLYIVLIVFAINLLGDFLRDELNPKLR